MRSKCNKFIAALVVILLSAGTSASALAKERGGGRHGGAHFSGHAGGHGGAHFRGPGGRHGGGHFRGHGGRHGGGHFHGHFHGHHFRPHFGFFVGSPLWPWYDPWPSYYHRPYYYPPAVAMPSSPPVYIERGQSNDWYYCSSAQGYYPYVKECPGGWQRVSPQPSAQP